MNNVNRHSGICNAYQSGIVTTFTGVMILVLLTLMMFFAIRVGVFEQRVSANEMRQKEAFHAAESGINLAKEYFRANSVLVASSTVDLLPNGDDGWLAGTSEGRWVRCDSVFDETTLGNRDWKNSHPCAGESSTEQRKNSYFYSFGGIEVPLNTNAILPDDSEQVSVYALLCVLDFDPDGATPAQKCIDDPADADYVGDGTYYIVTLLARGEADCDNGVCNAEALISEKVSPFGAAAGGKAPNVPLTTKSSFPPSGTAEVVANPNTGGVGVPVSVWMNNNSSCPNGSVIDPSSGSWATCEYHEWYETESIPEGVACTGNCSCSEAEAISYTDSQTNNLGIDLVADVDFPCDLFRFYFGVPRTSYEIVKGYSKVINDCSSLGPNSFGIYWVTGTDCDINANTQVGSPGAPVMLVSAATETRLNGGAIIYGTLFITDTEDSGAELVATGTNTVYGSVIVDGTLGSYNGTFQVVWNENISKLAGLGGGLGSVLGGWSDFHLGWEWE